MRRTPIAHRPSSIAIGAEPEMPSFLNDENLPVFKQSLGVVQLDAAAQLGLSHERVNGHFPRQPPSEPSNASFEDSSTHSTNVSVSDDSDARARVNGDGDVSSWPSMTTLHNESPVASIGAGESEPSERERERERKHRPNGISTTLVDRTVPAKPLANGHKETDKAVPSPREAPVRTSTSSYAPASASAQPSPVDLQSPHGHRPDFSNGFAGNPAATSSSSLALTTPTTESGHRLSATHRFSGPPYSSMVASPNAPGSAIKHRHTLEVPKPSQPRGSRDGLDSAVTTGRFSPTSTTMGGRRPSLGLARRNTQSIHSNVPRDEVVPDEDALRWAEAYRAKRASKRRRREIEDDDRVLVGTKVDESHANWVAAYNMLTGIRVSVSRTNAKLDRPLTDADFEAKQKSTFDIAGNELVPSAKYDFKFKDYAPWVFRHLRALFRLDPADYLISLTGKYILSELGSPGKSGSFFYFSRDYKYIIKTIHHSEHKFLRKVLKDYYQHVEENPNTLLSQFYGLHRVKMPYGKKIHFVVMNNLFPPHRDIHQTFDLKGSTVGRDFKEEDLSKNPRATLKDLNWLRRTKTLELGVQKKQLFLEQLHKDVRLLQKLNIMDYSLLIGIHDIQKGNEENVRDKTLRVFNPGGGGGGGDTEGNQSFLMRTPSKLENQRKARELRQMIKSERPVPMGETLPNELEEGHSRQGVFYQDDGGFQATHEDNSAGDEIYYLGVIDCLTHYGMIKKIEHFWKGLQNDVTQISPLPPVQYGDRFLKFISGVTASPEQAHREAAERDAALAAEAAAAAVEGREHVSSWGLPRRRSSGARIPPISEYRSRDAASLQMQASRSPTSPGVEATKARAEHESRRSEKQGASEETVPGRVLRTASPDNGPFPTSPLAADSASSNAAAILPVVDEAAEDSGSNFRLDGRSSVNGLPRTPPKTGHEHKSQLKPDSADSGYGVSGSSGMGSTGNGLRSSVGSQRSVRARSDKALPPLPNETVTTVPRLS